MKALSPYLLVAALAIVATLAVVWALQPDPDAWERRAVAAEERAAAYQRTADSLLAAAQRAGEAAQVADSLARQTAARADTLARMTARQKATTRALRDSLATAQRLEDTVAIQAATIESQALTIGSQDTTIVTLRRSFAAAQERAAALTVMAADLAGRTAVQQAISDSLRAVLRARPNRTRRDPCLTRWPTCLTLTVGGVVSSHGAGLGFAFGLPIGRPGV